VAQLGARFHGMEEVIGSIPIRSTNQFFNLGIRFRGESGISLSLKAYMRPKALCQGTTLVVLLAVGKNTGFSPCAKP
jgi:hypothetical protein